MVKASAALHGASKTGGETSNVPLWDRQWAFGHAVICECLGDITFPVAQLLPNARAEYVNLCVRRIAFRSQCELWKRLITLHSYWLPNLCRICFSGGFAAAEYATQ